MSDSEDDNSQVSYDFAIIQFIPKGRKRKLEDLKIVPSKWIDFDNLRSMCITKFLDKSNEKEDSIMLDALVQTLADAPEDWPTFPVELKGRAKNYEDAVKKIHKAQKEYQEHNIEIKKISHTNKKTNFNNGNVPKEPTTSSASTTIPYALDSSSSSIECDEDKIYIPNISTHLLQGLNSSAKDGNVNDSFENVIYTQSEGHKDRNHLIQSIMQVVNIKDDVHKSLGNTIHKSVTNTNFPLIQNFQCKSEFEFLVLSAFEKIHKDLADIKRQQENMSQFLLDKRVVNLLNIKPDFLQKYKLKIPIEDLDSFKKFDEELKINTYLKNDVCTELRTYMDKDFNISKTYVKMLKAFLTKEVAVQFTAVRKSRSLAADSPKEQFKTTQLCQCMDAIIYGVLKSHKLEPPLKDLTSSLSDVLCNTKKWK